MPATLRQIVPWSCAGFLGFLGLIFPAQAFAFAPLFFLASAIVLGIPHGACDPWVPGWVRHTPSRIPFLVFFFVLYLFLSFLYLLLS